MTLPSWLDADKIGNITLYDAGSVDSMLLIITKELFVRHIIKNSEQLFEFIVSGALSIPEDEFISLIESFEGELIYREDTTKRSSHMKLWVDEEFIIQLSDTSERYGSYGDNKEKYLEFFTTNEAMVNEWKKVFASTLTKKKEKGTVCSLTTSQSGLKFTSIGNAGKSIVRDNYTKEVQEAYDQIVNDLCSDDPSGRLSIIDGPAGSGKTHLIKGILADVKAMFILISPDSIQEIGNPNMIPLLIETYLETKKANEPIVFILEDADAALVPREHGNSGLISSLLNYTDGIFGALFDLRVIATTNAKKFQIEEALLRAGRLSCQITVDLLSVEDSNRIYFRLTKDELFKFTEPTRLADIYAKAHGYKTTKEKSNKIPKENKVGFNQ